MREPNAPDTGPPTGPEDLLSAQALLYAGGDLDADEAAAFERRLGEDQAARDALCHAVRLLGAVDSEEPVRPDPLYRHGVYRRLWPAGPRLGLGLRPAGWLAVGAVAALVVLLTWPRLAPDP